MAINNEPNDSERDAKKPKKTWNELMPIRLVKEYPRPSHLSGPATILLNPWYVNIKYPVKILSMSNPTSLFPTGFKIIPIKFFAFINM